MSFAIVNNNVITEIVDLDDESYSEKVKTCQQIVDIQNMAPYPKVGWIFDGASFYPPPGQSEDSSMIITRLAFRNRFTPQEKAALYTAASTPGGIMIKIYLDDLSAATFIDLSRPDTIVGINTLAAIGILTPERANVILTKKPSPLEIYRE